MNRLAALVFCYWGVCAVPAHAALVYDGYATGPGGLSTPYPMGDNPQVYAGMLEMTSGGHTILVFDSSFTDRVSLGTYWQATVYTYDDIQSGHGRFTKEQYARAGYILNGHFNQDDLQFYPSLRALAEAKGNNMLAGINTQVWDIMASPECPLTVFGFCNFQSDTFNWSNTMVAIEPDGPGGSPWLVPIHGQGVTFASGPAPSVPVPASAWLLGSGLLGLVGVARKRRSTPH